MATMYTYEDAFAFNLMRIAFTLNIIFIIRKYYGVNRKNNFFKMK